MEIRNNNNIALNFRGTPEVVHYLGKALLESHTVANQEIMADYCRREMPSMAKQEMTFLNQALGRLIFYINKATEDTAFGQFIDAFENHLAVPTKTFFHGIGKDENLLEIAKMPLSDAGIKERSFRFFVQELKLKIANKKIQVLEDRFQAFLDAIDPTKQGLAG